jgi:glycosyltransferase involved in cell wall biosynthesis
MTNHGTHPHVPPPDISVVVPAYREVATIAEALGRMRTEFDRIGRSYEVLLVSDGNTDGTAEAARDVDFPECTVFHYEPNRGKGYALRYGFDHARGRLIAFLDADLDIHPSCVSTLVRQLEESRLDGVIGSKVHPASTVVYPAFRRFQSRVFRTLIRTLFHLDVADTQTGCKVFRREVLDLCLPRVRSDGFLLDLELLVLANDASYRVAEGPIILDYQFATSTGMHAVRQMLTEVARLARRRRREQHAGTWITPNDRPPAVDG